MPDTLHERAYALLTSEDDGRICRDIPEEACREQPPNFLKHVLSLGATKTGDGLADPRLVLAWLLGALGAPPSLIGLLVPVREAGALLPQLITAGAIRSLSLRKWAWAAGSAMQGVCVAAMGAAALVLDGVAAGISIVALLGVFSLARSVCSVSYKDVLGKTVSKSTRGTVTGTAGTVASAAVLLFGVLLSVGALEKSVPAIASVLMVAGALWLLAAVIFATLAEVPGATEGGGNPLTVAIRRASRLYEDRQLLLFILARALLVPTALAPPYIVALGGEGGRSLGDLGPFVIASALAAVCSTYVWGRLSDVSSRKVLMLSGLLAAAILGAIAAGGTTGGIPDPAGEAAIWLLPASLFVLVSAYQGVRLGRSTHLVDMADEDDRATYTALSNTIIGVVLIAGAGFGWIANAWGTYAVLGVFAAMCLAAAVFAAMLEEVQRDDG